MARGKNVFDPAHPERNTPESVIEANTDADVDGGSGHGIQKEDE